MTYSRYALPKNIYVVRDAPQDSELKRRFQDAVTLFRMRTELFLSLNHTTTTDEKESLEAMVEVIHAAKRNIQNTANTLPQ